MIDRGKRYFREILDALAYEIEHDLPIVVLEPSCAAAFHDELPAQSPDDERARRLSRNVVTLAQLLERTPLFEAPKLRRRAVLHGHCHHKAIMNLDCELELLDQMRVAYETPESGCCGMAGAFGFEREKVDVSRRIGELSLLPRVRECSLDTVIIADGFSCREQIRQGSMRRALHLAEVLGLALHQPDVASTRGWPEREARALAPRDLVRRQGCAIAIAGAAFALSMGILIWAIVNLPPT